MSDFIQWSIAKSSQNQLIKISNQQYYSITCPILNVPLINPLNWLPKNVCLYSLVPYITYLNTPIKIANTLCLIFFTVLLPNDPKMNSGKWLTHRVRWNHWSNKIFIPTQVIELSNT